MINEFVDKSKCIKSMINDECKSEFETAQAAVALAPSSADGEEAAVAQELPE